MVQFTFSSEFYKLGSVASSVTNFSVFREHPCYELQYLKSGGGLFCGLACGLGRLIGVHLRRACILLLGGVFPRCPLYLVTYNDFQVFNFIFYIVVIFVTIRN